MQPNHAPTTSPWTIEALFDAHFAGARPSAAVLATLKPLEQEREEVRDFVARNFRLMQLSHFDIHNFSPMTAGYFRFPPRFLPGAWGGAVPPFTMENRHIKIDAYLRDNPWRTSAPGTELLDVGCGFPPTTAIDAAKAFPDWHILGADPAFDRFILYDPAGSYACFDPTGHIRYFQAAERNPAAWAQLLGDPDAARKRFSDAFAKISPLLPAEDDGSPTTVEHDGHRLIRHPVRTFERDNLKFIQAGFGGQVPQADIIRSFNVLLYFDTDFRARADEWVAKTLRPGGLFLCGYDGQATTDARYTVSRKEGDGDDGRLVEKEFAFSIEHARPLAGGSWFSLKDNDREAVHLAELIAVLRADSAFVSEYDAAHDRLLAEQRLLVRDENGFLATPPTDAIDPTKMFVAFAAINQQIQPFTDQAVAALQRAGLDAWKNSAGHIAVAPNPSHKK